MPLNCRLATLRTSSERDWVIGVNASVATAVALGLALVTTTLAHAFQVASAAITARRLRREECGNAALPTLPASTFVLVPIAHDDPCLPAAIEALFLLEGRRHELVFCLPHPSETENLVAAVAQRHPGVPFRLLVGRTAFTVNPKLDNLEKALAGPEAEWCCIVDANIIVPPDHLVCLAAAFRSDVAVVSALPVGTNVEGFWSEVEAAFLNTYQARLQLTADTINAGFAHGKTMLFRTADLQRWGGIVALSSDVAEDAAITKLAWRDCRRVRLLDSPVAQPLGRRTFGVVWRRQVRWAQLRRQSFPRLFSLEPISTSLLPAISAGVAAEISGFGFLIGCLTSLLLWVAVETALATSAGWRRGLRYALACVVRDGLALGIWLLAWKRHTYTWRGNRIDMRHLRPPA